MDKATSTRFSRVCGLAAQQRVPLTMDTFDDLSDNYKKELFDDSVQAYVEYPEELNKKGKKVVMKTISNAWRTYKSRLVNCLRNAENPFDKFKDLTQEH
jgi:hypothetical protein